MKQILIPILFSCLLPFSSTAQTFKEKDVLKVVKQWWTAWEKDDLQLLSELVDERFVEYIQGPKRTEGKQAFLEMAQNAFPKSELLEWELKSPVVEFHDKTAVCHYFFEERYISNAKEKEISGCFTFILHQKENQWKVIASHGTYFE